MHIRPHIALKYDFNWGLLGLNYAYVDFPNGDISSDAIALSMDFPFSSLINNSEDNEMTAVDYFGADWSNLSRHRSHLAARVRSYYPASGSETASGSSLDNSFGLSAQVGMDYQIDKKWHVNASVRFIDIETEASFKVGEADGKGCADSDKGCIRQRDGQWVILNNKKGGIWRKCDSRAHCEEILDAFHASKG